MEVLQVKTKDDLRELVKSRPELTHVHIALVDMTGQIRGKLYSVEKLDKALEDGLALTRNFASADFTDVIYPVDGLVGGSPSFSDAPMRIVPESVREIPWESPKRNLFMLMAYVDDEQFPASVLCPRTLLEGVVKDAEKMGFKVYSACEMEFRLFSDSLEEAATKSFSGLTYLPSESHYLSLVRSQTHNEFYNNFIDAMDAMGLNIECFHSELGPGFHEAVLRYQEGMKAADNAAIYKTFTKAYMQRNGRLSTFMARCDQEGDGSSMHIHISLKGLNGEPAFYQAGEESNMSETMLHFIGGLQRLLPEFLLMLAPTVNSMRRFQPRIFAPASSSWAIDNRTTGVRVIPGGENSLRIENRLAGADANPYLVLAATLAAGLWGVENNVTPTAAIDGCLWDQTESIPDWQLLPTDFLEAVTRFKGSELAKEIFGSEFVRIFSTVREFQYQDYQQALKDSGESGEEVTQWERERFLEQV